MVELTTSWISHLKNADHVGLTTQILDSAKESGITDSTFQATIATLEKAVADEDEAYKKTQKDWAVEELKDVDVKLDAYMVGIRSIVAGHAALPDSEKTRQKAAELLQLWKDYSFRTGDSYTSESSKVINMFQEVEKLKADAEAVGVWSLFEQAKKLAEEIQDLLGNRFTDLASRVVGEMKRARAATDDAVKQLYRVIDSMQVLTPGGNLTALQKRLRAIEDYARVYYLKTTASSGENTPGGDTGGSTGPGSNPNVPPVGGGD